MTYQRKGGHTVYNLTVHIVWVTKYRKNVLRGSVQERARELVRQVCDATDVEILKGAVGGDHIHIHISYPAKISISEIVRKIKGRTARKLLQEYPNLKKEYWGGHMWGIGYGAWSTGNITQDVVNEYIASHSKSPNTLNNNFILVK